MILNLSFNKMTTIVNRTLRIIVSKRTMMVNPRMYNNVARAAYYAFTTLTNDDVIKNTTKSNRQLLVDSIVEYALNPQKGIPQHKTKFVKAIVRQQFTSEIAFDSFQKHLACENIVNPLIIKNEPNTLVDSRFMNEFVVLHKLLLKWSNDIEWLLITNDARAGTFSYQYQTNPDFWVMLNTKPDRSFKCVYHDEKSGNDMFHSSRGSLGMITYDEEGLVIPFTTKNVNLAAHNYQCIQNIRNIYNKPMLDDVLLYFQRDFEKYSKNPKATQDFFDLHKDYQNFIWDKFQLDTNNPRSMSFIFTEQVSYKKFLDPQEAFTQHFKTLIGNRSYDMDRQGDRLAMYSAILIAYQTNVDRDILKKLTYLNKDLDIEMNPHFWVQITRLLKDGLLT